jgi:molybdopterin biosynthesis enzyme
MAKCDGLAVIDENRGNVEKGEEIDVLLFCNKSGL